MASPSPLAALPSVDRLLRCGESAPLIAAHGRAAVTDAIRVVLDEMRAELRATRQADPESAILARVATRLAEEARPSLRPVFNLTGTVLHTNLGRALLPQEAIDAMVAAASEPTNLEFDL